MCPPCQTDSPGEAKNFTVNGTLANVVKSLAPIWTDPACATTSDGKKVLSFLLNLVSCVYVLPPEAEPIFPDLDRRLLPALGTLCISEPELRRRYPEVGNMSVGAALEGKSMLDLCMLARENDVDITHCDKTPVIRALVSSGKAIGGKAMAVPVQPATTDRDALMELFNSTKGPLWSTSTAWGTSASVEEWHGVSVASEGWVTALHLRNNNLAGTSKVSIRTVLLLLFRGVRFEGINREETHLS